MIQCKGDFVSRAKIIRKRACVSMEIREACIDNGLIIESEAKVSGFTDGFSGKYN